MKAKQIQKEISVSELLCSHFAISLDESTCKQIDKNARFSHFLPHQLVIKEGDYFSTIHFITKGVVRGFYIDEDGKEVTKCFSAEGNFFASEGMRGTERASYFIQTIEDVESIALPYKMLHSILADNPQLGSLFQTLFLEEIGRLEERSKILLMLDSTQRYLNFFENHPDFANRVPLKYIASYIGVQPASLSRIRKNISSQN